MALVSSRYWKLIRSKLLEWSSLTPTLLLIPFCHGHVKWCTAKQTPISSLTRSDCFWSIFDNECATFGPHKSMHGNRSRKIPGFWESALVRRPQLQTWSTDFKTFVIFWIKGTLPQKWHLAPEATPFAYFYHDGKIPDTETSEFHLLRRVVPSWEVVAWWRTKEHDRIQEHWRGSHFSFLFEYLQIYFQSHDAKKLDQTWIKHIIKHPKTIRNLWDQAEREREQFLEGKHTTERCRNEGSLPEKQRKRETRRTYQRVYFLCCPAHRSYSFRSCVKNLSRTKQSGPAGKTWICIELFC